MRQLDDLPIGLVENDTINTLNVYGVLTLIYEQENYLIAIDIESNLRDHLYQYINRKTFPADLMNLFEQDLIENPWLASIRYKNGTREEVTPLMYSLTQ